MEVTFVTGNQSKFDEAKRTADSLGITLLQEKLYIRELQSEDIAEISLDKAKQAFEQLKKPLFVNDSGWNIPTLNGFPGSFMAYVNNWFTPEDFIRLVADKADRTIILEEIIVYIDQNGTKTFKQTRPGMILEEPRGKGRYTCDSVVSFDGTHSIAEQYALHGEPPKDNNQAYTNLFTYLSSVN